MLVVMNTTTHPKAFHLSLINNNYTMERGRVNDVDDISEEEGDNQLFDNQLLRNERSAFEDDEV